MSRTLSQLVCLVISFWEFLLFYFILFFFTNKIKGKWHKCLMNFLGLVHLVPKLFSWIYEWTKSFFSGRLCHFAQNEGVIRLSFATHIYLTSFLLTHINPLLFTFFPTFFPGLLFSNPSGSPPTVAHLLFSLSKSVAHLLYSPKKLNHNKMWNKPMRWNKKESKPIFENLFNFKLPKTFCWLIGRVWWLI